MDGYSEAGNGAIFGNATKNYEVWLGKGKMWIEVYFIEVLQVLL